MKDNDVFDLIEDGMAGVHMRRPVDTVVARGRTRRRRRRVSVTAAIGVTVGLALALPVAGGPAPAPSNGRNDMRADTRADPAPFQVRMVGFTLDGDADGTVRLTLSHDQAADPAVLERELAKAGIRAKVNIGKSCADPRGEMKGVEDVVKDVHPGDNGYRTVAWIINPKAMKSGAHLNITLVPAEFAVIGFVADFGLMADDATPNCTDIRIPVPRRSRT